MTSESERRPAAAGGISGEERAIFEAAVATHHSELRAFAYRVLGGRAEADDVLQNVYLSAVREAQTGRSIVVTRPWLYRVVYTSCIDELRRAARRAHDVLDDTIVDLHAPLAAEPDLARGLSEALLGLPASARAAVLLVDVHGLSYDDAALVLQLPRGTIASRLNHGRRALRHALVANGLHKEKLDD